MSKAFDFVNHHILLQKCERYGLRGKALEWIRSYLTNRTQCVQVNKVNKEQICTSYQSKFIKNCFGVPQGSILGPLLFLIYINDLPKISDNRFILFADDISVIISEKEGNKKEFEHNINDTVQKVMKWLNQNNLCANLSKTNLVQFRNYKREKLVCNINYNGNKIEEASEAKFLGLIIDQHMNWKKHIELVCTKINKYVYALNRIKKLAGQKAALTAYHGYVASVLRYGILLWGNSTDVSKAFIAQKKCIRQICNVDTLTSCRPLFKNLRLLTIACLYIYEASVFVKKNPDLFNFVDTQCKYVPRDKNKIKLPICKSALYRKNCYFMSIKIYNEIPKSIRDLTFKNFSKSLYNWLTNNCFYTLNEYFSYKNKINEI